MSSCPKADFALTPQDYRQGIDLLMTAGVNQVIYHGTPYRWDAPGYGEIGWSPFISPYGPTNISTNVSESDPFWKYQREINVYAARLQTLMQMGEPDADLLVYLPVFDNPSDARFTPVLQTLDTAGGSAWEWVNDDLIRQAKWTPAGLVIGSMTFQGVILPDIPALPLADRPDAGRAGSQPDCRSLCSANNPRSNRGSLTMSTTIELSREQVESIVEQPHSALITDTDALARFVDELPARPSHIRSQSGPALHSPPPCSGRYVTFVRNTDPEATLFHAQHRSGVGLPLLAGANHRQTLRCRKRTHRHERLAARLRCSGNHVQSARRRSQSAELTSGNPVAGTCRSDVDSTRLPGV